MDARLSSFLTSLPASVGRRIGRGPALVAVLGGLAYHALWLGVLTTDYGVESWFFRPSPLPPLLVLAVAGWLVWRRRERLRSLGEHSAPLLAAPLAALGAVVFGWAVFTRTADLLLPSISANLLAFAAVSRGGSGCRAVLLPALVLLFGAPIPAPLQDEILWGLQLWTASGAAWLLDAIGQEFFQGGVILRSVEHTFHVIDSCSGLKGIEILMLVALIVRELFADSGRRQWLLVAIAPVLGFALNALRIAYVAASPHPEALAGVEGDHTPQGLAVLIAGTGLLYALGSGLARNTRAADADADAEREPGTSAVRSAPWGLAAIALAGLVALTLALPRFEPPDPPSPPANVDFPKSKAGWTGEEVPSGPLFLGSIPGGLHRRYEFDGASPRLPQIVDLVIGFELAGIPYSSRLLSSKRMHPGPDWDLVRKNRERLWLLNREADLAVASRGPGSEHAVVYTWRPRHRGLWRESWRSLLAIEASPFRREDGRAVVRLVAYAPHDGQLALDRAKQRLDRFIAAFRQELAPL